MTIRKITIITLVNLCLWGCSKPSIQSSLAELKLNGNIVEILEPIYKAKKVDSSELISFDSIGYSLKKFNDKGMIALSRKKIKGYSTKEEYLYNKKNLLKTQSSFINGEISFTENNTYNSRNQLIHKLVKIRDLSVVEVDYKLDRYGNLIEENSIASTGNKTQILYITYSESEKEIWNLINGKKVSITTVKTNSDSLKTERVTTDLKGRWIKDIEYHNLRGKISKKLTYEGLNIVKCITTYQYDSQDRIIKKIELNTMTDKKKVVSFMYTNDAFNNWIEKKSVVNGKLTAYSQRIIKYNTNH